MLKNLYLRFVLLFGVNPRTRLLFIARAPMGISYELFFPLYAIFVSALPITTLLIVVSTSLTYFYIIRLISSLVLAEYLAKTLPITVVLLSTFGRILAWLSFLIVTDVPTLLLSLTLIAVTSSAYVPSYQTLFTEALDRKHESQYFNDSNIIDNCIFLFGTFSGGVLVALFGFQWLFVICALLSVFSWVVFLRYKQLYTKTHRKVLVKPLRF